MLGIGTIKDILREKESYLFLTISYIQDNLKQYLKVRDRFNSSEKR